MISDFIKFTLAICMAFIFSCSGTVGNDKMMNETIDTSITAWMKTSMDTIHLHKLKKLFIVGDFAGHGEKDTVFQHNYSQRYKMEIDSAADPFQNDWDAVEDWFYNQDADVFLVSPEITSDTLHLGAAQGLYCLINIGDLNADGKEEMAFVINYFGSSRVNTCQIYTVCQHKWVALKQFGIHEDAFNFTTDMPPVFAEIDGYLVKEQSQWVYKDYLQEEYDSLEDVGKMKVLTIEKCN